MHQLCFNPCFIGTYSFTISKGIKSDGKGSCFNPCFIGTYSFTHPLIMYAVPPSPF